MSVETKATHTPGPWKTSGRWDDDTEIIGADGFQVANVEETCLSPSWLSEHEEHWAQHFGESFIERPSEEVAANARLIAAAPELLEAAREALATMYDPHSDAGNKLRASIQKATGEIP